MTAPATIRAEAPAPFDLIEDWDDLGAPARPSLVRPRDWRGTAMQILATLAVAVGCYAVSLGVSAEREAVEKLQRQNRAMTADIRALDAELRVRMRLPQLQRWNDEVLGLQPVSATQFVDDPARLGAAEPVLPEARLAIAQAPSAMPGVVLASAQSGPQGLVRAPAPVQQARAMAVAPVAAAPVAAAPAPAPKPAAVAAKPAVVAVKPAALKPVAAAKPAPAAAPKPSLSGLDALVADAAAAERRAPKDLLAGPAQ